MSNLKENPQTGPNIMNPGTREEISRKMREDYLVAKKSPLVAKEDYFSSLTCEQIYFLGQRVIACDNIWQAYDLLAEEAKPGICYYDLIFGPQHYRAYKLLAGALAEYGPPPPRCGLDIGAGSGLSSAIVMGRTCRQITAVDLNPALLGWAEKRLRFLQKRQIITGYGVAVMDAIRLGFPQDTFDAVIAHGIDSYFTPDELGGLYREIWRVLKPGGCFFKYLNEKNSHNQVYQDSPKARLAGEVVRAVMSLSYASFYQIHSCINPSAGLNFSNTLIHLKGFPHEKILRLTKRAPGKTG